MGGWSVQLSSTTEVNYARAMSPRSNAMAHHCDRGLRPVLAARGGEDARLRRCSPGALAHTSVCHPTGEDQSSAANALVTASRRLSRAVATLRFSQPVATVYNPLEYAWQPHELYLRRFGGLGARVLLVGMNPGPHGMVQTGVPFGDIMMVRDWMGIEASVSPPAAQHPKRPVLGFACSRSEVSGTRLWGWAQNRFATAEHFFSRFFVTNYCPLAFLTARGSNHTPDKLPRQERESLLLACDTALESVICALNPSHVLGVGAFAAARVRQVCVHGSRICGTLLHPSPASPRANRGWAVQAEMQLAELGIDLPSPSCRSAAPTACVFGASRGEDRR